MVSPDDLYALPLEEFTAARNALAKELARGGDPAAAAEVKRLPKPTRTAWALNQVARHQRGDVDRLLEAGARVREAQERALGGDASHLRAATRAEQEMVDPLMTAALSVLGRGPSTGAATADRVRNTLRAAATDREVGSMLRGGRLVADLAPSGFGLEGLAVPSGPSERVTPGPATDDVRPAPSAPREDRSASQARAARREAEHLRSKAEHLRSKAETARRRADRLADQADRAERRADDARREAAEAADAAAEAARAVDDANARAQAMER